MPQIISQDQLHAIIDLATEASLSHPDSQVEVIDATADDVVDAQESVEAEAVPAPHAAAALHQITGTLSNVAHHLQDAIVAAQADHVHDSEADGTVEDTPYDETAGDHVDTSRHDDSAVTGD